MDYIVDFLMELLNFGSSSSLATNLWNSCMVLLVGFISVPPNVFSPDAYNFVVNDILPLMKSVGITLTNLLFMIGLFREAADLRKNLTWEILIYSIIKVVLVNVLLLNGVAIMNEFFKMSSLMSIGIVLPDIPAITPPDSDIGAMLLFFMIGLIYLIVSVVCVFIIFQTIAGRYLHLYLLIVTYPIGVATIPGGSGIDRTASSWVRSFIGKTFEIVVISLTMVLSGKIMSGVNLFSGIQTSDSEMLAVIMNLFHMAFMTASIKGTESFIQRTFGL